MTDNELIAEFMGYRNSIEVPEVYLRDTEPYGGHISNFEYHTSWDWLMPVVEKIESMNRTLVNIYSDATKIWVYDSDGNELFAKTSAGHKDDKIGHVYRAVVEFIKWYNSQKV